MVKVESAVPLYKQIVHDLVSRIESGVYSEGDKLPTETELMEEYGVSRITVRSAIKELEDADIVERTRGKGTFVTTTRNAYAADDQESFTHSCIQENKKPSTVVLEVAWIYPTLRDVRFLQSMACQRCWKPIATLLLLPFWNMKIYRVLYLRCWGDAISNLAITSERCRCALQVLTRQNI